MIVNIWLIITVDGTTDIITNKPYECENTCDDSGYLLYNLYALKSNISFYLGVTELD